MTKAHRIDPNEYTSSERVNRTCVNDQERLWEENG